MTQTTSLGQRLAHYRKTVGLSAQSLADKIGVTRAVVNNLELGRREDITLGQLVRIADSLEIPPSAIAADIYHPFAPSGYGDLSNWDVVRILTGEAFVAGEPDDIIYETQMLVDVVERWGKHANDYIEHATAAKASGDTRDASVATYARSALERSLERGKAAYARLEKLGVDVSWARGDWMDYEIPDHGFGQAES